MSEESDPAADVDLQAKLLQAAKRMGSTKSVERVVTGGDKARIVKAITARWEIRHGEYAKDTPTDDELVNICIQTPQVRGVHWMLYMCQSRASLDLAMLIKKPTTRLGLPARQIQVIENHFNGPAWDVYQSLGVMKENVGLVVRLGSNGLYVYGHLGLTPVGSGSVCFCLSDPYDQSAWRTIFPLEGLLE